MTGSCRVLALAAAGLLATPAPSRADQDAADLTTPVWREPDPPAEPLRALLSVPEAAFEIAFLPVGMTMSAVEHWRLDRRLHDLLRNDAGTVVLTPRFKLATGDGLGAGARLSFSRLIADDAGLAIDGLARLDGDWEVGAGYWQRIAHLEGRRLELGARAERDGKLRYFGLGNDSDRSDERVIAVDRLEARGAIELTSRGVGPFRTVLELTAHRQRMAAGSHPSLPGLGQPGDMLAAPDDFGMTAHLGRVGLAMIHDSRDSIGRPTRGLQLGFQGAVGGALDGGPLGAAAGRAGVAWYLPVLPDKRVLVLAAGAAATAPLASGHGIPLADLTVLGGGSHLRGFAGGRFRDRHGWWSAVEYRWPLWQTADRALAVDAALFVEAGRVAGTVTELFGGAVHADGGASLRVGDDRSTHLQLDVAGSREGLQVGISIGEAIGR